MHDPCAPAVGLERRCQSRCLARFPAAPGAGVEERESAMKKGTGYGRAVSAPVIAVLFILSCILLADAAPAGAQIKKWGNKKNSKERNEDNRKHESRGRQRISERSRDREKPAGDEWTKKENPGHKKKIVKPGHEKHFRSDRPGGGRGEPARPDHPRGTDPWNDIEPSPPVIVYPYPVIQEPVLGGSPFAIHLPGAVFTPWEVEESFLGRIEWIRAIGRGDSMLVCLYQVSRPLGYDERAYIERQGVIFYRDLTPRTHIVDSSVENVFLVLLDMPYFRWIGEYKGVYKYKPEPDGSERPGAYIHSLDGDREEFRVDLEYLGIELVDYNDRIGGYYVMADWNEFADIAGLWWVFKVFKEPPLPPGSPNRQIILRR